MDNNNQGFNQNNQQNVVNEQVNNQGFNQNNQPNIMNQQMNNQQSYNMNNQGFNQSNQPNVMNQQMNNQQSYNMNNQGFNQNNQPNIMNQQMNNQQGYNMNNQGFNQNNQPNVMNQQVNNQQGYNMNYQQNYGGSNSKFKAFLNGKNKKSILKIAAAVAVILVIAFIVIKCTRYNRTIMLYMVGSNLEEGSGLATYDLEGINYEQLKKNKTKLVVIAGGAKNWHNSYIDVNSTSIYELTAKGYKKVKYQGRKNMGSSSALSGFLNYSQKKYPAKKYDLIFWNHGLGVFGGESDTISGDYLSLAELKSALSNSKFKENNKLELVLFRTCLNGTIEVAETLKNYANFMVASQEITRGYQGNNVLKVLNTISKSDDAKKFGIKFVDAYMKYIDDAKNYGISSSTMYNTYSVIDLSKINNVEVSLNDFVKDINLSSSYNQISRVRATMLQYAGNEDPSYDSIDLYNFVEKLQQLSSTKAQKVLNSINAAVVYSKATDTRSKGLSIYFPYNGSTSARQTILNTVYKFNGLRDYGNFINSFDKMKSSGTTTMSFAGNAIDIAHSLENKEADFQLELTDEQAKSYAKSRYIVFQKTGEDSYLPVYSSENVSLENNVLKANIKDRQLKMMDSSDNSEQVLTLIETENTEDYILYYSLVLLSNYGFDYIGTDLKIMQAKMILKLDKKTNKVSVENVLLKGEKNDNNNGKVVSDPYTIISKLEDYKYITISITSRKILNEKGEYDKEWVDDDIKAFQMETKDLSFELEDYTSNKEYYAVFNIVDIYGNSSYSKLVSLK